MEVRLIPLEIVGEPGEVVATDPVDAVDELPRVG